MNVPSRGKCEFKFCNCDRYIGTRDNKCEICGHGDCWHEAKIIDSRFISTRNSAHTPKYVFIFHPE